MSLRMRRRRTGLAVSGPVLIAAALVGLVGASGPTLGTGVGAPRAAFADPPCPAPLPVCTPSPTPPSSPSASTSPQTPSATPSPSAWPTDSAPATAAPTPTDTPATTPAGVASGQTSPPTPQATPSTPNPAAPAATQESRPFGTPPAILGVIGSPPPGIGPSPPPPPPPLSAPTTDQLAAAFADQPFGAELLAVLRHPVAGQPASLLHFRPALLRNPVPDALGWGSANRPPTPSSSAPVLERVDWRPFAPLLVAAFLVGAATAAVRRRALGAILTVRRLHRSLVGRRRLRLVVSWTIGMLAAVAVAGAVAVNLGPLGPQRAPAPAASPPAVPGVTVQAHGTALWVRLVDAEGAVAVLGDTLARQETEMVQLASAALTTHPATASPPAAVPAPSGGPGVQLSLIAELVREHHLSEQQFRQGLEQEYRVYQQAAGDPQLARQLVDAAAAEDPSVGAAVTRDLALATVQVAQEQALAGAEASLDAPGSGDARELATLSADQPPSAPVDGPIVQAFGPTDSTPEPPLLRVGVFYPRFDTGIDLTGAAGAPVHAAADGVVLLAATTTDGQGAPVGYGRYVLIAHPGGVLTVYAHLDAVSARAGEVVHRGDVIGTEGATGDAPGPELHFEVRQSGQLLDPQSWLGGVTGAQGDGSPARR